MKKERRLEVRAGTDTISHHCSITYHTNISGKGNDQYRTFHLKRHKQPSQRGNYRK